MILNHKVAIVTGAGRDGSGRAVARRFAKEGAAVVVNDINEAGGLETVRMIEQEGGRAAFFPADVGEESKVQAMIAFAESQFGGLDILVNNASAPFPPQGPLKGWFDAVRVDLLGAMYGALQAVDPMRKRGGGAIVNIGSTSAIGHGRDHSNSPGYDVSKMGVIRLTTTLGWLGKENIRVNCLVPAWVASEEVRSYWVTLTPEARKARRAPDSLISLEEFSSAVLRLATDANLAGRVMVYRNGQAPYLIAEGDPGYASQDAS
jgi:NAD(P)-dependent dehydrogenase (short-subunit alcohol dehydrogenase family)